MGSGVRGNFGIDGDVQLFGSTKQKLASGSGIQKLVGDFGYPSRLVKIELRVPCENVRRVGEFSHLFLQAKYLIRFSSGSNVKQRLHGRSPFPVNAPQSLLIFIIESFQTRRSPV